MRKRETLNLVKSRDRGPLEFKTHIAENDGDIMSIAKKEVITIPQSANIKETANIMVKHQLRRIPVTDPGTGNIRGIVTSTDILDFLGGGDKYKILEEKHEGNFLAAVNEPVREIMTRKVEVLKHKDSITDAIKKMKEKKVGGLPVLNSDEKIAGIVSERDIAFLLAGVLTDEVVEDYMTKNVITITPGTRIEGASKIMVRNGLRRIPVVGEERKTPHPEVDKLMGIVTSTDILKFLGANEIFHKVVTNDAEEVLNTIITEIMIKNVLTTAAYAKLGNVCDMMRTKDIGGLPVVRDNDLLGIITERDILDAISG